MEVFACYTSGRFPVELGRPPSSHRLAHTQLCIALKTGWNRTAGFSFSYYIIQKPINLSVWGMSYALCHGGAFHRCLCLSDDSEMRSYVSHLC